MNTIDGTITKKQITILTLIGFLVLCLFVAGFIWLVYYVRVSGDRGGEKFLDYSPYWVFPYLVVMSIYVGIFAMRFAIGSWKLTWLWGILGFALTLLFILIIPTLLLPIFPDQGPLIFNGPAIFAFLAPILSALIIVLLIFTRRKSDIKNFRSQAG